MPCTASIPRKNQPPSFFSSQVGPEGELCRFPIFTTYRYLLFRPSIDPRQRSYCNFVYIWIRKDKFWLDVIPLIKIHFSAGWIFIKKWKNFRQMNFFFKINLIFLNKIYLVQFPLLLLCNVCIPVPWIFQVAGTAHCASANPAVWATWFWKNTFLNKIGELRRSSIWGKA